MARLPAVKLHLGLTDTMIGVCLFVFGVFGLLGLSFSNKLITKLSSRNCLIYSSIIGLAGLLVVGFAPTYSFILLGAGILGIGVSVLDVAMNTQGLLYEHKARKPTMNLFHAFYSFGAVLASIVGSICAALMIGVETNFIILGVPFILLCLFLQRYLLPDYEGKKEEPYDNKSSATKTAIPLMVFICGVAATLDYATEGSVGEWGALYLTGEKKADQSLGALVYGIFSIVTFTARLFGDWCRKTLGENNLMIGGTIVGFLAMLVVLSSSSPLVVLVAYGVMGFGLAPIVPTLFSLAGRNGKVAAARATSVVAFMAYSGLLFVPPSIGWLASHFSLHNALYTVLVLLTVMFALIVWLRKMPVDPE